MSLAKARPGDRPPDAGDDARTKLLQANLAALRRRFPELAQLVAASDGERLEPLTAASGEPSARVAAGPGRERGPLLHSSRDPRAEARRIAKAEMETAADTVAILGLGLGYLAEAFLEAGSQRVIACEADPGSLASAFRLRDLSGIVADERLGFVVGGEPEAVITALELAGGTRAAVFELGAATAAEPEWFERARRAAERWNAKGAVNENTLRRFGRLWVRNLSRNLEQAAESAGVEALSGLFAGGSGSPPVPALVLAAGPSLDLVLPSLRALARRAVILCVDTALRSVLRCGLEPDFLVVVDPQYWNWRHIAGLSFPSSFLVSETAAWPAVFRARRRGTFLGGSLFPLGRRIESFAGSKGHLGAGGSVATSAWDLGRILGCSPLWVAGLDLGFPGGQTHAKASLFEQRALAEGRRLEPAARAQAAAAAGSCIEAASSEGGRLRTDERMTLYAWWFESRFSRPGSPPTISLSPGGLAVPGLRLGTVEELLSGPDRRPEIDGILGRAQELAAASPDSDRRAAVARGLASLREQLESIAREAEAATEAAREGRMALDAGGDLGACLSVLDRADSLLLSNEARDVAGFLLPPLRDLVGRRVSDLGESLDRSRELYRGLAESARYHLQSLRGAAFEAGDAS